MSVFDDPKFLAGCRALGERIRREDPLEWARLCAMDVARRNVRAQADINALRLAQPPLGAALNPSAAAQPSVTPLHVPATTELRIDRPVRLSGDSAPTTPISPPPSHRHPAPKGPSMNLVSLSNAGSPAEIRAAIQRAPGGNALQKCLSYVQSLPRFKHDPSRESFDQNYDRAHAAACELSRALGASAATGPVKLTYRRGHDFSMFPGRNRREQAAACLLSQHPDFGDMTYDEQHAETSRFLDAMDGIETVTVTSTTVPQPARAGSIDASGAFLGGGLASMRGTPSEPAAKVIAFLRANEPSFRSLEWGEQLTAALEKLRSGEFICSVSPKGKV